MLLGLARPALSALCIALKPRNEAIVAQWLGDNISKRLVPMQNVTYSPVLLDYDEEEEILGSPSNPASLKCFAAFPKLHRLCIDMEHSQYWPVQLDAALEGTLAPLYATLTLCTQVCLRPVCVNVH